MIKPIIHILGPGGAGKSTAGELLAEKLGWVCIDLDRYFMQHTGDIARFIEQRGYVAYAQQNVSNYLAITSAEVEPVVIVLSSGFMTYPADVVPRYRAILDEIERHPFSALLLPSFDLEECVEVIVSRQLQRHYLAADRMREEERIRVRFPLLMALRCNRFLSKASPSKVASELETFFMANQPLNARPRVKRGALAVALGKEGSMLALSIVSPHGMNIASGKKSLEVRSWRPETLPIRNLLIVENSEFLSIDNPIDPNGKAVAIVDIEEIHEWQPSEVFEACSNGWEPGYWAWSLSNVRPITTGQVVPAKRKLYEVGFSHAES